MLKGGIGLRPSCVMPKNLFAEPRCLVKFSVVTELIRKKVSALPHKPGIYLMRDRFGTVIYVGKARNLRKRVSQYFQKGRRMGWDLKFNALVEAISDFDIHLVRSE